MFYVLVTEYDATSIKKLEKFIQNAKMLIDAKDVFWLSIQSNTLADVARMDKSFNIQLNKLILDLKSKSFVVPLLNANMRNSSQISNIKIDRENSQYRMSGEIEKLSSSVMGQPPTLSLVNQEDLQQELPIILGGALDEIDKDEENNTNIVVLYNEKSKFFNSNLIQRALLKTTTTKQINVFDPKTLSETQCQNNLKNFLSNRNQILVVSQELFTGCESSHIIYLGDDKGSNNFIRCGLLRAVEHLTLVFAIDNDDPFLSSFDGFTLDSKQLKCIQTLNRSCECDSCCATNICKSCSYFCHRHHQLKQEEWDVNEGKPCQCEASKTCKLS